jgi:hypothetical protein
MTRTLTVREYLLEELNRLARARGDDIEIVFEYPEHPERRRPHLAAKEGEIVEFPERPTSNQRSTP